jgi:hypothetical protein
MITIKRFEKGEAGLNILKKVFLFLAFWLVLASPPFTEASVPKYTKAN